MNNSANHTTQAAPDKNKKHSKFKRMFIPVSIVLGGLSILIIAGATAPIPQKKNEAFRPPLVKTLDVNKADTNLIFNSQGVISPRTETLLISEVAGVVKQVSPKFISGGFFRKGEKLLEIDPLTYEVALLQAQAKLDSANARLIEETARGEQAEKEWKKANRSVTEASVLALRKPQLGLAKAEVKAAEAELKNAQIKLNHTIILAPYDALVKEKSVDIGQYVSVGTPLASTFAIDYAEVRLPIKESELSFIKIPSLLSSNEKGAEVELWIEQAGKIIKWQTFISRSEGVIDEYSRVNYVVAAIHDPYGILTTSTSSAINNTPIQIGAFVNAKIIGKTLSQVISIPRNVLRAGNDIYTVGNDRKLGITKVDIVHSDAENIYVSNNLATDEKIVLTKIALGVEGMTVRLEGDVESVVVDDKSLNEANQDLVKHSPINTGDVL